MLVVVNPGNMGQRSSWCSAIRGSYAVTPALLESNSGPIVKYMDATNITRNLYVSDRFVAKHDELYKILRAACALRGSKWSMYRDLGQFSPDFEKAVRQHRSNYYAAVLCRDEAKERASTQWQAHFRLIHQYVHLHVGRLCRVHQR